MFRDLGIYTGWVRLRLHLASVGFRSLALLLSGLPLASSMGRAQPALLPPARPSTTFFGLCNASAGIDLGGGLFVVADDEDKVSTDDPLPLRIYDSHRPGREIAQATITAKDLSTDSSTRGELDLEGAARMGDRIYWIGSHSADKEGRERPSTQLLFATRVLRRNGAPTLDALGRPYRTLLRDLAADPRYRGFDLIGASRLPSKESGGLSIEGLAATPSGGLLVGLRNPLVERNRALVVPLLNPAEVLEGRSARFGDPTRLDLQGLGVRSIEALNGAYWIVAGPFDNHDSPFELYYWSGNPTEDPEVVPGHPFGGYVPPLHPEGVFAMEGVLRVISDDGKVRLDNIDCEKLKKRSQQRFRSLEIAPFSFQRENTAVP